MRVAAFGLVIVSSTLLPGVLKAQATDPAARCESIQDQQVRDNCFAQVGVPVIHCTQPKDADEAAFCRSIGNDPNGEPANTAGAATRWWCDASRAYYPSVPTCATPWRAIAVPSIGAQPVPRAPALRVKKGGPITDCDTYAASPDDAEHVTDGIPIEKINPGLAVPACESAVRQHPDNPRLIYQLGRAYYKAKNFAAALLQFRKAAEQSYVPAQYNLGWMYAHGLGVSQDYLEAMKWLRRPTDVGYAPAQQLLGAMYANGFGVTKDYAVAVRWYRAAAAQGYAPAQGSLGGMYYFGLGVPQNYAEAMRWTLGAADQGNALAQNLLGEMYFYAHGVPQNYAEAVGWWRKAANQGNPAAQSNLGAMYANGQGVPKNFAEAVRLYRLAAEQGNAVAEDNLGIMYSKGYGVPLDFSEAENWWRKAAEQGNASAQSHLATLQVTNAEERGYKRISFEDFMLDGKELAATSAKLSIQGFYVKEGQSEFLFPSAEAIFNARETLSTDAGIGVLTDDASRNLRKLVLDCRNNPQFGCSMTVVGHASICTRTMLVGSTNIPCLVVEDGAARTPQ